MFPHLLDLLQPSLFSAAQASLERHRGENFYGVALHTSSGSRYLVDSNFTTTGLRAVASEYLQMDRYRDDWKTLDVAMRELKWSPCDSPYHAEFACHFDEVNEVLDAIWSKVDLDSASDFLKTCRAIHETAVAALVALRDSGLFPKDQVVFNLLMGDQSNEDRYLNAEQINSQAVLASYRSELEIDKNLLEYLRLSRWSC